MVLYLSKYIAGIYRQSKIEINREFRALGLRATEGDLMLFLHDNPGLSQKKVAILMVLDPSLIGRDLQHLIAEKYVERKTNPDDNRINQVFLTERGENIVEKLQEIITNWWNGIFLETKQSNEIIISSELEKLYETIVSHVLRERINK